MSKLNTKAINLTKSIVFGLIVSLILIAPLLAMLINILIIYIRFIDGILLLISLVISLYPLLTMHVTMITYNNYIHEPLNKKHYLYSYGVPISVFMFILNGLLIIFITPMFF